MTQVVLLVILSVSHFRLSVSSTALKVDPTQTIDKASCAYSTCSACVNYIGCGWCSTTGSCVPGTSSGSASCPSGFSYYSCAGSTTCSELTSCSSCVIRSGCGWCNSTSSCVAGTEAGSPQCTAGFDYYSCSNRCSSRTNCSTCIPVIGCGWCSSSSSCVSGTASGSSSCPGGVFGYNTCSSNPSSTCSISSCSTCVATVGCGWCSSTSSCVSGTLVGSAYCPAANFSYLNCPASECESYSGCVECAQKASCGWCASSRTCMFGSSFGPTSSSCSRWTWFPGTCQTHSHKPALSRAGMALVIIVPVVVALNVLTCVILCIRKKQSRRVSTAVQMVDMATATATPYPISQAAAVVPVQATTSIHSPDAQPSSSSGANASTTNEPIIPVWKV